MADFSKWPFFKIANSRDFFAKISQIRCCQSDGRGGTQKLPDFCFEQNGCNGLWWLGADACSSHLVDSVANVLKSLKNPEIPKTIVSKRE